MQFKYFTRMFRVLSGKNQSGDPNAITAREALLLSAGGRVGGGNIAGVAVAVTLGGPGAVSWMWASAQGLRRGLFSNEAGLGSAPNVAATASVRHPISQGITQSFSVFIDTIVICSCTAFVILLGDVYVAGAQEINGVALTQQSLVSHLGEWTQYFLTGAVLLFAFSSIIYNYYLGENALTVMTDSTVVLHGFKLVLGGIVFLGAVAPAATSVFFFSDPMMGILAVVNLLALLMLFLIAKRMIVDFSGQLAAGADRPAHERARGLSPLQVLVRGRSAPTLRPDMKQD